MKLELNLWFSTKSGHTYGNLNINQKEEVHNIDKLLPVAQFCDFVIKKKIMTEDAFLSFMQADYFDENAKYAATKEGAIVSWNSKNDYAIVIYMEQVIKLLIGVNRKAIKGMPDVYFRA